MTTAIIHHPVFEQHDTGAGHPESPERYAVVWKALRGDAELWPRLKEVEAAQAPRGVVQAAHTPQHFKHVERAVSEGLGYLRRGHGRLGAVSRSGAARGGRRVQGRGHAL